MTDFNSIQLFGKLVGKTLVKIDKTDDLICFLDAGGKYYLMYHNQSCCENVYIDDVVGDLDDLLGHPVVRAEVSSNNDDPAKSEYAESYTWTYYKLATIKGSVDIRWYGSSNGYYSESVDFVEFNPSRMEGNDA